MLMSIYIFSHLIKISLRVSIIRQFIYMLNIATWWLLYYMSLHIAFMEILSIKLMATYLSNINCSFTFCVTILLTQQIANYSQTLYCITQAYVSGIIV